MKQYFTTHRGLISAIATSLGANRIRKKNSKGQGAGESRNRDRAAITHPKNQETLLKFGDLSSAREHPMCIYSIGQVLRSVTSKLKAGRGHPGVSLLRTLATDNSKTRDLIHCCFNNKETTQ